MRRPRRCAEDHEKIEDWIKNDKKPATETMGLSDTVWEEKAMKKIEPEDTLISFGRSHASLQLSTNDPGKKFTDSKSAKSEKSSTVLPPLKLPGAGAGAGTGGIPDINKI